MEKLPSDLKIFQKTRDPAFVVVECKEGHVHKILAHDIMSGTFAKINNCETCSLTGYHKIVRDACKKVLGIPMSIDQKIFSHPGTKLWVVCNDHEKVSPDDKRSTSCDGKDGVFVIKLGPHKTAKIVENDINYLITPRLNEFSKTIHIHKKPSVSDCKIIPISLEMAACGKFSTDYPTVDSLDIEDFIISKI